MPISEIRPLFSRCQQVLQLDWMKYKNFLMTSASRSIVAARLTRCQHLIVLLLLQMIDFSFCLFCGIRRPYDLFINARSTDNSTTTTTTCLSRTCEWMIMHANRMTCVIIIALYQAGGQSMVNQWWRDYYANIWIIITCQTTVTCKYLLLL